MLEYYLLRLSVICSKSIKCVKDLSRCPYLNQNEQHICKTCEILNNVNRILSCEQAIFLQTILCHEQLMQDHRYVLVETLMKLHETIYSNGILKPAFYNVTVV